MLFSLDGERMKDIPRRKLFNQCRNRLSGEDYRGVVKAINAYVTSKGAFTSSFMPVSDWNDTPYYALYVATDCDEEQATHFFNSMMWHVIMERSDRWYFVLADEDSDDTLGIRYFRAYGPK